MALTLLFSRIILFLSIPFILRQIRADPSEGFRIRLIHRDSPLSPFYDPKMTKLDRIISAVNNSFYRVHNLEQGVDFSSELVREQGEYLMMFYVGNPPTQQAYAIADTGSDLIWLQCTPCKRCYKQNLPIFNPAKSRSFTKQPCGSPDCNLYNQSECSIEGQPCTYKLEYIDGTFSQGVLSRDLFHFEDPNSEPNIFHLAFGCSDYSTNKTPPGKQTGIVGLNRNPLSLVSQLGIKRFSHCMVAPEQDGSGSSRMYFGSEAVISGGQTPLLKSDKQIYYLALNEISVGDEEVLIQEAGIIIDSGSTFTLLESGIYDALVETLTEEIKLPRTESPSDKLKVCFVGSFDELELQPDVTFHFENTDVILMKQSTYVEVQSGVWCLAILPSKRQFSIFGNYQQRNFWVGYDLENEMVSFAPVDCAIF